MSPVLYTSKNCGYCPTTKKFLAMKGVDYTEKNTEDPLVLEEMLGVNGGQVRVPTFYAPQRGVVIGPNFGKIMELLT